MLLDHGYLLDLCDLLPKLESFAQNTHAILGIIYSRIIFPGGRCARASASIYASLSFGVPFFCFSPVVSVVNNLLVQFSNDSDKGNTIQPQIKQTNLRLSCPSYGDLSVKSCTRKRCEQEYDLIAQHLYMGGISGNEICFALAILAIGVLLLLFMLRYRSKLWRLYARKTHISALMVCFRCSVFVRAHVFVPRTNGDNRKVSYSKL